MRTYDYLWRVFITEIAAVFVICFGGIGVAHAIITPCTDNFFDVSAPISVSNGARSVAFADFNRDGIQDVITPGLGFPTGTVNVRLGNGTSYGSSLPTTVG